MRIRTSNIYLRNVRQRGFLLFVVGGGSGPGHREALEEGVGARLRLVLLLPRRPRPHRLREQRSLGELTREHVHLDFWCKVAAHCLSSRCRSELDKFHFIFVGRTRQPLATVCNVLVPLSLSQFSGNKNSFLFHLTKKSTHRTRKHKTGFQFLTDNKILEQTMQMSLDVWNEQNW